MSRINEIQPVKKASLDLACIQAVNENGPHDYGEEELVELRSGAEDPEKKPYVVEITESYSHHVIIWAYSESKAIERAEQLCEAGDIDLDDRNHYDGCSFDCLGTPKPNRHLDYPEYM